MADVKIHRRGRGAGSNPANRFERLATELDAGELDEAERRAVKTQFLTDASRSVLSENNSPDVGFRYSLNPFRGCEHGCSYCLDGDTRILLSNGRTRTLRDIRVGDEIYGTVKRGHYRRFERTRVLAHWATRRPAFRVMLQDGTELVASGDHLFLTERGWKHVTGSMGGPNQRPYLTTNNSLMGVSSAGSRASPAATDNYKVGYLAGMIEGDGHLIAGQAIKTSARLKVKSVAPIGTRDLYDITTGTGDFFANGVVSHNCYARPSHEYLGFSAGLDFETKIVVKRDAPRLLSEHFEKQSWEPQVVALSGNTDPYQPVERKLELTRACLEVFRTYRNPVSIITKNHLVTRDIDILADMARLNLVNVNLSITSLRDEVTGKMEPRTSRASRRLAALRELTDSGIPAGVMIAPVVPGLTDEEMPAILETAHEHGATSAGYIVLRLPGPVAQLFVEWVEREYPLRASKILSRVRSIRKGKMNDADFGVRMRGTGHWADLFSRMFAMTVDRLGMNQARPQLETKHFRRSQHELF